MNKPTKPLRILIIDDNQEIHNDFIKILKANKNNQELQKIEQELFGKPSSNTITQLPEFIIDTAYQGEEGFNKIKHAIAESYPYALAFVDIRMPPGWDGIKTIKHIWEVDPEMQIVICTAYSDYSWESTIEELGVKDNLLILKKPFDASAVKQLSLALTKRWQLMQKTLGYERAIKKHTAEHAKTLQAFHTEFQQAITNHEFFLRFQPQIDLSTHKIFGVEALLRWQHPQKGELHPMQFLSFAEELGLMNIIGNWVLKTACADNKAWQTLGLPKIKMSVNISNQQLEHPDFVSTIKKIIQESTLAPQYLELELTENIIFGDIDAANKIQQLRQDGISIALDDFGTGYSSLNHLRTIPIDRLKIDKSFVQHATINRDDEVIIQAVVTMAKSLNLRILVEGVETQEQLDFLKAKHCDEVQGYYFSKPLTANELIEYLKHHSD